MMPEQVKRMIVEVTSAARQKWSHESIRAGVGGPRGNVHHVMASLSSGPPSASETYAFCEIDFENDPLLPDWQTLEKEGILPALREAKSRIYAEGSQGKIRTSPNRWTHFTATKARVRIIRPRVGDNPEAFVTESPLRQSFLADCVSGGCNVETAEQYASLYSTAGTLIRWATDWSRRARSRTSSSAARTKGFGGCFPRSESIVQLT